MQKTLTYSIAIFSALFGFSAHAEDHAALGLNVAKAMINYYGQEARKLNPNAKFSAEAGRAFYVKKVMVNGKDLSCASCHGDDPAKDGKHTKTGKPIKPLAISANPERFNSSKKIEQKFFKHCVELYENDCSAQDKGDYMTYLLAVEKK